MQRLPACTLAAGEKADSSPDSKPGATVMSSPAWAGSSKPTCCLHLQPHAHTGQLRRATCCRLRAKSAACKSNPPAWGCGGGWQAGSCSRRRAAGSFQPLAAVHQDAERQREPDTAPDLTTPPPPGALPQSVQNCSMQGAVYSGARHAGGGPPPDDGQEKGPLSWLWSKDDLVTYGLAIAISLLIRE